MEWNESQRDAHVPLRDLRLSGHAAVQKPANAAVRWPPVHQLGRDRAEVRGLQIADESESPEGRQRIRTRVLDDAARPQPDEAVADAARGLRAALRPYV